MRANSISEQIRTKQSFPTDLTDFTFAIQSDQLTARHRKAKLAKFSKLHKELTQHGTLALAQRARG